MRQLTLPLVGALLLTASAAHAQNLILNGDFNSPLSTGWTATGGAGDVVIQNASPGSVVEIGVGNTIATLFQSFTLASATSLQVAFDFGTYNPTVNPATGPWRMDVTLKNAGATTVYSTTVDAFNASQSGVYRTELSFSGVTSVLPSGTYTLTFAPQSHGWTTVDNVSVTATAAPEPTTLALLGLGGLCLARRRSQR